MDELVQAYRSLGHTLAQLDPLEHPRARAAAPGPGGLRLRRGGPGSGRFVALLHGRQEHAPARNARHAPAHLHGQDRRGVHAHRLHEGAQLGARPHRSLARNPRARTRRPARASSATCSRRRRSSGSCTRATSARSGFRSKAARRCMPLLETILDRCPALGIQEIVMGMAHRGRLNVLANFMKKSLRDDLHRVLRELHARPHQRRRRREVPPRLRVHARPRRGHARSRSGWRSNPSHLEFVDPVVRGQGARPPAHPGGHRRAQGRSCRCSSTATPRSSARASWPRRST